MTQVRVIQSSTTGDRLGLQIVIGDHEYGYNATTGVIKLKTPDGKFRTIQANNFIRTICTDRYKAAVESTTRIRKTMDFYDKNPNYVPLRDRPFNGNHHSRHYH